MPSRLHIARRVSCLRQALRSRFAKGNRERCLRSACPESGADTSGRPGTSCATCPFALFTQVARAVAACPDVPSLTVES